MSILDLDILLFPEIFRHPLQLIWLEIGKERRREIVSGKEIVNVRGSVKERGREKEKGSVRGREIETG